MTMERIKKLKSELERKKIDLALIFQNKDLFYFSGTMQSGVLAVPKNGEPILFIQRNYERAIGETWIKNVVKIKSFDEIKKEIHAECIGVEKDVLPIFMGERIEKIFSASLVDISGFVREMRAVKDEKEIRLIKKSASINDAGHRKVEEVLREGISEVELSAEILSCMRKLGDDGSASSRFWNSLLPTQIASGESSAIPNRSFIALGGVGLSPANPTGASRRKIKRGIPVYIDLVPSFNGYCSDATRIYCIGEPSREVAKAYEVCMEIYYVLLDRIRPGIPTNELWEVAVSIAEKRGYARSFLGIHPYQVKFVGHGVGLELDELPVISKSRMILSEGMVVAVEPKIVTREGGVGIEDTILVKKKGTPLTKMERGIVIR